MDSGSNWVPQNYANCLFVPSSALQMEPGADDLLDGDEFGKCIRKTGLTALPQCFSQ